MNSHNFLFKLILKFRLALLIALLTATLPHPTVLSDVPEISQSLRYGGNLRLGWFGKPATLDPFNVKDSISSPLMDLIFNRLIRVDENGDFVPDLAKRWEVSSDGLVYTFFLRQGVTFHNGKECNAADVLSSFRHFSDKNISPTYAQYFDTVEKMEAPSDFIFRVTLKKPFSPFLFSIWKVVILSEDLLPPEAGHERRTENPIGTGPFKFKERDSFDQLTFAANPNYFEGRPYLDSITVKSFAKKNYVWSAFMRGDIDIVFQVNRENFMEISDNPAFKIYRSLSLTGYVLIFNLSDPLLSKRKVRQAISLAINRDELINVLESGDGAGANGPFYPSLWNSLQPLDSLAFDPEKAKGLLQNRDSSRSEPEEKTEGKELILDILVDARNAHYLQMAKLIRQQLQEIDIQVKLSFFKNIDELAAKVYKKSANFQALLFNYHSGPDPDFIIQYWYSDTKPTHFTHYIGNYENPRVNRLIEMAHKESDKSKRLKIYQKISRFIETDKPVAFLYFPYTYIATSSRIQPSKNLFLPGTSLNRLKEVFIAKKGGE